MYLEIEIIDVRIFQLVDVFRNFNFVPGIKQSALEVDIECLFEFHIDKLNFRTI